MASLKGAFLAGSLLALFLTAGCASLPDEGQVYRTPEAAIQQAIAAELGMPVALSVETFSRHDNWAFVAGRPLTADRTPIDYSATPYAKDLAEGYFDDNFVALVERSDADGVGWTVVELSLGATDAPFVDWPERYGLPRTLVMPGPASE